MLAALIGLVASAGFAALMILQPQTLTRITGQELTTPEARNEARATYGGMGVGLALAFFIALVYSPWRTAIGWTIGLMLLGMAGVRGYSWYSDRTTSNTILILIGVDAVLGLVFAFFMR